MTNWHIARCGSRLGVLAGGVAEGGNRMAFAPGLGTYGVEDLPEQLGC